MFSISRHGSKEGLDHDPQILAAKKICKTLGERFLDIARLRTEEEVDEIGMQLLVTLESCRAKSASVEQGRVGGSVVGRSNRVAPQRGSATLTGAAAAARSLHQPSHLRNSFEYAVNHRLGSVVERHDGPAAAMAQQLSLPSLTTTQRKNNVWGMLMRATNGDGTHDIFLNFVDPTLRTPEMRADYLSFKVPLIRTLFTLV